ncbi:MAG: hypothetical protein WAT93_02855, partial [Pontixanthobacter sp.]
QRSRLQQIGQMAASGNLDAASSTAFAGGDLDIGASLRKMSAAEQRQLVEDAAAWAYAAKDPQTWEAGRQDWIKRGFDPGDFSAREPLLSRALSVKEQMAIDMQRESVARSQANADRAYALSAAKDTAQNAPSPTGNPIADREYYKTFGKQSAERDIERPQVIQKAQDALDLIQQIKNHEGLADAVGPLQGRFGPAYGRQADAIALIEQLGGKAFLEAFESLKGGGQITEVEGKKATNAIARLQRTQSEQGFNTALDDLASVVEAGLARARNAGAPAAVPTIEPPETGAVVGGYRYTGGDPAIRANWEKVE